MENEYSKKISKEEIAAIAGAIHLYLEGKEYRIVKIEPQEPSYWKLAGRIYQMEKSHYGRKR